MPCNSDYMNPSSKEKELSRVACLLDELNGKKWTKSSWAGYHPTVYCKTPDGDKLVSTLCQKLQNTDVSKYSLEMQMWWRDHQEADKQRVKKEIEKKKTEKDKQAALAKLSSYERKLLGVK